MNSSDSVNLIWLVGAMVLVVSALSVRRMSFGFVARSIAIWAVIILVTVVAVAHRGRIGAVFAAASASLGLDDQQVQGKTVRIRMSPDGHFWARVTLNGVERRMLVDSGATITAISDRTAQAANISVHDGLPAIIETANGSVAARRGTIDELAVGPLKTQDLGVVVAESFGDLDVLGMNFLSRLHSWRVEGNVLILEPKAQADDDGSDATTDPAGASPNGRPGARKDPSTGREGAEPRNPDTEDDFT
ncbi:TIGR02281 family clan AA aspartic protease [Sphingomonas sp. JC676]|uniref:retropepsin-like aspartic protease family protein n=1 Tax=Sphingomonas sp. JC676 TaxID=2768065 RepID=UPI00165845F5|nr:TIGR02281 family clan AA aspartic protease [Sphingomonas sp. JC676]MBC9031741.1 TIGR02281 family clan AA aspartic protease [Sphingomonas sp. JC676]